MNQTTGKRLLFGLVIGAVFLGEGTFPLAAQSQVVNRNDLQRSHALFNFQTAAQSGHRRAEEIYYIKCWLCHNRRTIAAGTPSAPLNDLYQRTRLMNGQPVNDQTVAEVIRNGSDRMPAYRHSLSDGDIDELLSYLREGECCFRAEEPPPNPWYKGSEESATDTDNTRLLGGPRGSVRSAMGEALEGIMVQLISQKTAIRTTVYSNKAGEYEFPKLGSGAYTLRIARPMENKPYQINSLAIDGATEIDDIVLERVSDSELLPPTSEIAAQMTGADWLMNLPGTGQEKRIFNHACGSTCHSYQQVFKNRYDEQSWRLIIDRMLHYSGSPLINPRTAASRVPLEDEALLVRWLGKARGPDSEDAPFFVLPRASGAATRVIITEYELPRVLLAPHDVHGDSQGGIWYTPHRSPYIGRLNPLTGKVEEYRVPAFADGLPGTHRVWVDQEDIVWVSENWTHNLTRFDPKTKQFRQFHFEEAGPLNGPGFSNFAMDLQGFVYETLSRDVVRIDKQNGQIVKRWPIPRVRSTYDNIVTPDGRFWAGGTSGSNLLAVVDTSTDQVWELETRSLQSRPARGGFDSDGIAWFGGRGGTIVRLDPTTREVREYWPPIPYVTFYEVMPDQRGEIWAGAQHGGRFMRFNPSTDRWIQYVLPEPYSHNRRTWIDNSTTPVTVWYVDNNGYIVRIQPLE